MLPTVPNFLAFSAPDAVSDYVVHAFMHRESFDFLQMKTLRALAYVHGRIQSNDRKQPAN